MEEKKIVEDTAHLARIYISEQEKSSLNRQLSKIINYIDKLKELNVEGVEPLRCPHLERNIFREDKTDSSPFLAEEQPSSRKEDILKNAPQREGDFFKIPKVIE